MSNENCNALAFNPQVTTDDIVAIRISELEVALMEEEVSLRKERESLEKEAIKLQADLDKAFKDFGEEIFGKRAVELKNVFAKLYPKLKVEATIGVEPYEQHGEKRVCVRMTVGSARHLSLESNIQASESTVVPWPSMAKVIEKAMNENAESQAKNHEATCRNATETRKLPAAERAVKAALAKRKVKELGEEHLIKLMEKVNIPAMRMLPLITQKK